MTRLDVFHGTSKAFAEDVRSKGLHEHPGSGLGVRVTSNPREAKRHARAWVAYTIHEENLFLPGMIVCAKIDHRRLTVDRHGRLRADFLLADEISLRGPIEFPELAHVEPGPGALHVVLHEEAFVDAIEEWERLTARTLSLPFPRPRARRS